MNYSSSTILFIAAADVIDLLPMEEAIGVMGPAFAQLSDGNAKVPRRIHLPIDKHNGMALFMPVYLPDSSKLALKTVTINNNNPARDLPLIHALVTVFDAETGIPQAVMDGAVLTAIRTGAASGLATDLLARRDATRLVIFGAGTQGRTQAQAVCAVRSIEEISVVDLDRKRSENFAQMLSSELGITVHTANAQAALSTADVVCTATTATKPVFLPEWVRPGTHINGVGSYTPRMSEIPAETIAGARVFTDSQQNCWDEAGDLIQARDQGIIGEGHIIGELGELFSGTVIGRKSDADITFFKSVGNAVQDLAAAQLIIENARQQGRGQQISL